MDVLTTAVPIAQAGNGHPDFYDRDLRQLSANRNVPEILREKNYRDVQVIPCTRSGHPVWEVHVGKFGKICAEPFQRPLLRDVFHLCHFRPPAQQGFHRPLLNAQRLEYRPGTLQMEGSRWPVWLAIRPLLLGLASLAITVFISNRWRHRSLPRVGGVTVPAQI